VLLRLYHHSRNPHSLRLHQGLPKQGVGLVASADRREIVRTLEIHERNLRRRHKGLNLDGLGTLGKGLLDLFISQNDIPALFIQESFNDILLPDLLPGILVDPFVPHRVPGALVQPVKIQAGFACCRMQRHGDVHKSEADCSVPNTAGV